MEHITETIMNNVIDLMPQRFDSHGYLEKIIRRYPKEYVKELCRFQDNDDPFLVLHPLVARMLSKSNRVRQTGKVSSPNIGGNVTINESWEKIN